MAVGLSGGTLICLPSHVASCAAVQIAMYSASVVDNATTGCLLLNQLTTAPDITRKIAWQVSISPAKLASE